MLKAVIFNKIKWVVEIVSSHLIDKKLLDSFFNDLTEKTPNKVNIFALFRN